MSAEFREAIRKVIRFSPDVVNGNLGGVDNQIQKSLLNEIRINPVFQKPIVDGQMQSIALPTVMALNNSVDPYLQKHNPWNGLSREDQKAITDFYGLHRIHKMVFHIVNIPEEIDVLASYMAATFAFTTKKVPDVVSMGEVIQAVANSYWEETQALTFMKRVGLLVVKDVMGAYTGLNKISGSVREVFSNRLYKKRATVFINAGSDKILDLLDSDKEIVRSDIYEMLKESGIGSCSDLASFIGSANSYINFNVEEPERGINGRRSKFFV